jgi:hypothetical protein
MQTLLLILIPIILYWAVMIPMINEGIDHE